MLCLQLLEKGNSDSEINSLITLCLTVNQWETTENSLCLSLANQPVNVLKVRK